jgi:hypothetical protein
MIDHLMPHILFIDQFPIRTQGLSNSLVTNGVQQFTTRTGDSNNTLNKLFRSVLCAQQLYSMHYCMMVSYSKFSIGLNPTVTSEESICADSNRCHKIVIKLINYV